MPKNFLEGILGSKKERALLLNDYIDLGSSASETEIQKGPASLYVRSAEFKNLNDVSKLKEEIYSGNVLLIDISNPKSEFELERSIKELRKVVADVNGDIARMDPNWVVVTPTSVRISREKIKPEE